MAEAANAVPVRRGMVGSSQIVIPIGASAVVTVKTQSHVLRLRSGPFSADTLVHEEQFLGLDGQGSVAVQTEDAAKHPTSAPGH